MKVFKQNLKKTFYLNSNNATKTTINGGKNYTFSWNVPELCINEMGIMQVASIASLGVSDTTKIYTFRLENLSTNTSAAYSSDSGTPVLCSLLLNNSNSMFRDDFGIYLMPQSLINITISVSDDYTNKLSGIATAVNFVICLVITEVQVELAEIHNPYLDAIQAAKGVVKYKMLP